MSDSAVLGLSLGVGIGIVLCIAWSIFHRVITGFWPWEN